MQSKEQTTPISKKVGLRNVLIVAAVTFTCFLLSGGQHLNFSDFPPHRAQGDDLFDDVQVYTLTFIYCGGAGALAGAVISSLVLAAIAKKKN
jgi:hypothetical protein